MGIVTKKGDKGMTSLYCGTRVGKDDIRVEACGALDEVSSFLGLAKSATKDKKTKKIVNSIQKEIMDLCSEIATTHHANIGIEINIIKMLQKIEYYLLMA